MSLAKSVTKSGRLLSLEVVWLLVAISLYVDPLEASTCHATCNCGHLSKERSKLYDLSKCPRYLGDFIRANCGSSQDGKPAQRTTQGYGILDASKLSGTSIPCIGLSKKVVPGTKYVVTAELFNDRGNDNGGHPGIAFNVQDEKNFDIVYFRPHTAGNNCYQLAKYVNGHFSVAHVPAATGACPGGRPTHRRWFDIRLEVTYKKATVFLRGRKIIKFATSFRARGRAAVLVFRGYQNVIHFRNFNIMEHV